VIGLWVRVGEDATLVGTARMSRDVPALLRAVARSWERGRGPQSPAVDHDNALWFEDAYADD
jgi:hypothetical protein